MDPFLLGDIEGTTPLTSAWLRGLEGVDGILSRWAEGLEPAGFWWVPAAGVNPIGGLVRHIGGSSARLLRYATGEPLPEALQAGGKVELAPTGEDAEQVLADCRAHLLEVSTTLRRLSPADLDVVREVGRKKLPVRAVSILHHLMEHAHEHAGQIIVMRKLWDARKR